jgi:hypothetical protein
VTNQSAWETDQSLTDPITGAFENSRPPSMRERAAEAQRDLMLVTLSQLRGDLRKLSDANVDAPNIWRWTVQRMTKRLEAYTGALDHLEQHAAENPSQPSDPA